MWLSLFLNWILRFIFNIKVVNSNCKTLMLHWKHRISRDLVGFWKTQTALRNDYEGRIHDRKNGRRLALLLCRLAPEFRRLLTRCSIRRPVVCQRRWWLMYTCGHIYICILFYNRYGHPAWILAVVFCGGDPLEKRNRRGRCRRRIYYKL